MKPPGSSPPVRGAPRREDLFGASFGLIPARAGSTAYRWAFGLGVRAHPRPCGEHSNIKFGYVPYVGSSPPVRGAQPKGIADIRGHGLIPARAGSTLTCRGLPWPRRAHPRPCGEHWEPVRGSGMRGGSSPPVRGALEALQANGEWVGLIPARAGSTLWIRCPVRRHGAHPRPCGEHTVWISRVAALPGSSPPVRGARVVGVVAGVRLGLIPARAGSTILLLIPSTLVRAHPRPCGEHKIFGREKLASKGSSPPVRGAPSTIFRCDSYIGLIPARAGSTVWFYLSPLLIRAHPRPCGEHTRLGGVSIGVTGSSPPVRGALAQFTCPTRSVGLIPARAGSTVDVSQEAAPAGAHPRPCGEHTC